MRVKLEIRAKTSNEIIETSALVNSGFETEKPQLLIPVKLATKLGLWPPPSEAKLIELNTAGGPIRNYLVSDALNVRVLTQDKVVGPILCDAVISHIEEEVLINDKLGEELKIMIIGMGSGKWKFIDDGIEIVRMSEKIQLWI